MTTKEDVREYLPELEHVMALKNQKEADEYIRDAPKPFIKLLTKILYRALNAKMPENVFKHLKRIVESNEGDTVLTLKQLMPVRLIKNNFYKKVLIYFYINSKIDLFSSGYLYRMIPKDFFDN